MINLKKIFRSNPYVLPVARMEKEILDYFLAHKKEFEQWLTANPQPRIRFQFYFPTAVDFFFDDFKLFTAYFKRSPTGMLELAELKMSQDNYATIRSANWKPFEEVVVNFLGTLEESNKATRFLKTKSLHEYASICENRPLENSPQSQVGQSMKAVMMTG